MKLRNKEKLDQVLFYNLEKAIKSYRQFAQRSIAEHGFDITIDQWLILKSLEEDPTLSQHQIAEKVFKDHASLTRMIELLVKKKYILRTLHRNDRRRFNLALSPEATHLLQAIEPLIVTNRNIALRNINHNEANELNRLLNQITLNCTE